MRSPEKEVASVTATKEYLKRSQTVYIQRERGN